MKRANPIIVLFLICSLALAGASRFWADQLRAAASVDPLGTIETTRGKATDNRLSNMDSYALALLLGGLRGPLVMFLWSTSEAQKSAHDLEDFDTKVEWIRLLQPEFDTVHLFQIWNKAYNVSVQMANLPNKYAAILDALDYANSVNQERPDDINIVDSIGNLFGDKMAGLQLPADEKAYYLYHVTQDTMAPRPLERITVPLARLPAFVAAARAAGMDAPSMATEVDDEAKTASVTVEVPVAEALRSTFSGSDCEFKLVPPASHVSNTAIRRTRLDAMLDPAGNLLPDLIAPRHPRPSGLAADAPWYDGSDLQFLKQYEPFPYGLSPSALGYNYYKRAQMLARVAHEVHLQKSDFVVDSRPALALKSWAVEAGDQGRRAELRVFGIDDHGDRDDLECRVPEADPSKAPDTSVLTQRRDPAAGGRALFEYALAVRLNHDAIDEYQAHLLRFPQSRSTFVSHIDDAIMFGDLYQGDEDFLKGVLNSESKASDWASAAEQYGQAVQQLELIVLRYFVDDDMERADYPTLPDGTRVHRETVYQLSADQRTELFQKVMADSPAFYKNHYDQYNQDRGEYIGYLDHCKARLAFIQGNTWR
ncbi:MAG: hypothetical protein ABSH22_01655 [Tepidisphaeraceae bacterium]|jgi:hypothetical protein